MPEHGLQPVRHGADASSLCIPAPGVLPFGPVGTERVPLALGPSQKGGIKPKQLLKNSKLHIEINRWKWYNKIIAEPVKQSKSPVPAAVRSAYMGF